MTPTGDLIAELRRHEEAMMEAPWRSGIDQPDMVFADNGGTVCEGCDVVDAHGIAYLRSALPRIIARLERGERVEKAVTQIATMEPYQHSRTCCEMHRIANAALEDTR
jgi:hypothetical protein